MKLDVTHPSREVEKRLLANVVKGFDAAALENVGLEQVVTAENLVFMQNYLNQIRVADDLLDYITDIVARTRSHRSLYLGASPRGSIALLVTGRARAAMEGRDFVIPDDIKSLAPSVLRHRLILHPDAEFEGTSADDCIQTVLSEARVPKTAA